jgi:hypothetical protein
VFSNRPQFSLPCPLQGRKVFAFPCQAQHPAFFRRQQGIHERADKYREVYKACANHLERLAESAVEYQVLKGLGTAGQAVGNFVSSIPVMKNGQVDEWFLANGKQLEQNGADFSKETLKSFQAISEPNCDMFADSLADVNRFFNQTREIYIGRNSVYFVKNAD